MFSQENISDQKEIFELTFLEFLFQVRIWLQASCLKAFWAKAAVQYMCHCTDGFIPVPAFVSRSDNIPAWETFEVLVNINSFRGGLCVALSSSIYSYSFI